MPLAALFHGPGTPFEIVDFPVMVPRGGELLVRIRYCTLCGSDLHTHAGRRTEPTPSILGHEILGTIAAFGPDAPRCDAAGDAAAIGDRVTWCVAVGCGRCFFCTRELPQKCESLFKYGHAIADRQQPTGGGLAEFILLREGTAWFRVPDGLPDRVAAPANCATATAVAVLRNAPDVSNGCIVIFGAGLLGLTASAMARVQGAREIVVVEPAADARQRALRFGATRAVSPGDLAGLLADITDGREADVTLELSGSAAAVAACFDRTRTGGTIVLAGTVSPTAPCPVDPERIVRRMLTIRGVHNYGPPDLRDALRFLAGPGRDFQFESLVGTEFRLNEIEAAFETAHRQTGQRVGIAL
jgi:putative phosphonate catabolism associated alcohol dehydrogenase